MSDCLNLDRVFLVAKAGFWQDVLTRYAVHYLPVRVTTPASGMWPP